MLIIDIVQEQPTKSGMKHPVKNFIVREAYSTALGVRLDLKRNMMLVMRAADC